MAPRNTGGMRGLDSGHDQGATRRTAGQIDAAVTIRLRAPLERVFERAVELMEHGLPSAVAGTLETRPAMGEGFRFHWRSSALTSSTIELVINRFVDCEGWTAESTAPPLMTWSWRFDRTIEGTGVTQKIRFEVPQVRPLRNHIAKWRVRRMLSRSLQQLKARVDRAEALDRLRRREWHPSPARPPPLPMREEDANDATESNHWEEPE